VTLEPAEGVVQAVVLNNGRLLLVRDGHGWALPSGTSQAAEPAQATAARVVYERTGYLVSGTDPLTPPEDSPRQLESAVVCQLLSQSPSVSTAPTRDDVRWTAIAETADLALPASARTYLRGRTTV